MSMVGGADHEAGVPASGRSDPKLNYCKIAFPSAREAEVCVVKFTQSGDQTTVADDKMSTLADKVAAKQLADETNTLAMISLAKEVAQRLVDDRWYKGVIKPQVAILVTGGAQNFRMPNPRVEHAFREGLVRAAELTQAWIFTGGSASGVMKEVGTALASCPDIECVGMPLFGNVLGHEQIKGVLKATVAGPHRSSSSGQGGEPHVYDQHTETDNSSEGAALEPHHTHFIMIDNDQEGNLAWGSEIEFALAVQLACCTKRKVPPVLLVVNGGPGTLKTVESMVNKDLPVLIIADSGGAATDIHDFLTRSDEDRVAISNAEAVLKGAQDDLQKELLKEAAKGRDRCKSAEAFVDEDSEFSTNFVREVSNGDKNLELAKAELRELELKLLKSSDLSWAKEDSLEQFRTLYQKKDLIQMLELGSNARLNIISDSILDVVEKHYRKDSTYLEKNKLLEIAIGANHPLKVQKILDDDRKADAAKRDTSRDDAADVATGKLADCGHVDQAAEAATEAAKKRAERIAAEVEAEAKQRKLSALQCALERQAEDVVEMLLSRRADVRGVLLSRLYMLPEKNRFHFFSGLQTKADAAAAAAAAAAVAQQRKKVAEEGSIVIPGKRLVRPAAKRGIAPAPRGDGERGAQPSVSDSARAASEPPPSQTQLLHTGTLRGGTILIVEEEHYQSDAQFVKEYLINDLFKDVFKDVFKDDPRLAPYGARAAPTAHVCDSTSSSRAQTGCRIEDLFYWALLIGNAKLAEVLWRSSKAHLRLALLAAEIYRKMSESMHGRKHRDEIKPLAQRWRDVACELLDHVRPTEKSSDSEIARLILTWLPNPSLETSLDLAMRVKAKQVIAHHHCQLIMTRRWTGHRIDDSTIRRKGMLRLVDDATPNWRAFMKAVIPCHQAEGRLGWSPAKVESNGPKRTKLALATADAPSGRKSDALYGSTSSAKVRAAPLSEPEELLPPWYHVYHIPVVKFWVRTFVSHVGVAVLNCALIFGTSITQPHGLAARPGRSQATLEVLFAVWIVGLAVDWVQVLPKRLEWRKSGLRPAWVYVDDISLFWQLLVVLLRVAYVLGCALASAKEARGEAAAIFGGGFGRHTDVATDWLFPIALALSSLSCYGRFLIETPLVFMRLGVLAISTREMLVKNLAQWGAMMIVVLIGFGLAFVSLVPEYGLLQTDCFVADVDTARLIELDGLPACPPRFASGPWFISVWALFGDFDIGALEGARQVAAALLLIVLLIIAQVLLLNLLIAMMTETYQDINSRASMEYKYEFALIVDFYVNAVNPTPPPINLIVNVFSMVKRLCPTSENGVDQPPMTDAGPPQGASQATSAPEGPRTHPSKEASHGGRSHAYFEHREEARAFAYHQQQRLRREASALPEERELYHLREALETQGRAFEAFKQTSSAQALRAGQTKPQRRRLHVRARSEINKDYKGKREDVSDLLTPWEAEWVDYKPIEFEFKPKHPWPGRDGDKPTRESNFYQRRSYEEEPIALERDGRPRNPHGRTGTRGRGILDKWGTNRAIDTIVLRRKPRADGEAKPDVDILFQMVAIQRPDTKQFGILGAMAVNGMSPEATLRDKYLRVGAFVVSKLASNQVAADAPAADTLAADAPTADAPAADATDEVTSKASTGPRKWKLLDKDIDRDQALAFWKLLDRGSTQMKQIYRGYVDDPRNTDNAWVETSVSLFYIEDEAAAKGITLSSDDTTRPHWLDVDWLDDDSTRLKEDDDTLYADHKDFIKKAFDQEWEYLGLAPVASRERAKAAAKATAERMPLRASGGGRASVAMHVDSAPPSRAKSAGVTGANPTPSALITRAKTDGAARALPPQPTASSAGADAAAEPPEGSATHSDEAAAATQRLDFEPAPAPQESTAAIRSRVPRPRSPSPTATARLQTQSGRATSRSRYSARVHT